MLRTEEDRQLAKETLMKHIPSVRHHAKLQTHSTSAYDHTSDTELKEQMLQLQRQMSALLAQNSAKPDTQLKKKKKKLKIWSRSQQAEALVLFQVRAGWSHSPCSNQPNPSLLEEKRCQLKYKQQSWEK